MPILRPLPSASRRYLGLATRVVLIGLFTFVTGCIDVPAKPKSMAGGNGVGYELAWLRFGRGEEPWVVMAPGGCESVGAVGTGAAETLTFFDPVTSSLVRLLGCGDELFREYVIGSHSALLDLLEDKNTFLWCHSQPMAGEEPFYVIGNERAAGDGRSLFILDRDQSVEGHSEVSSFQRYGQGFLELTTHANIQLELDAIEIGPLPFTGLISNVPGRTSLAGDVAIKCRQNYRE